MVNGEDQAQFDLYRDAMLGEMRPAGPMESMLAERVVSLSWRLRRTERMQNQAINEMLKWLITPSPIQLYRRSVTPMFLRTSEEDIHIPEPKQALGRVARRDWANERVLERLMIYERRMESSMLKMITRLKTLQTVRRMEKEYSEEEMSAEDAATKNPKAYLKKQTQFASAMIDAKAYARKGYGDKPRSGVTENKAKQTQCQSATTPRRAGSIHCSSTVQGRLAPG